MKKSHEYRARESYIYLGLYDFGLIKSLRARSTLYNAAMAWPNPKLKNRQRFSIRHVQSCALPVYYRNFSYQRRYRVFETYVLRLKVKSSLLYHTFIKLKHLKSIFAAIAFKDLRSILAHFVYKFTKTKISLTERSCHSKFIIQSKFLSLLLLPPLQHILEKLAV